MTPHEKRMEALRTWEQAVSNVREAKANLARAETIAFNARNALGRVLCPPTASRGAVYSVWLEESLIDARLDDESGNGKFSVCVHGEYMAPLKDPLPINGDNQA